MNGIVNVEKLTKYFKRSSNGAEEIYNTMIFHIKQLVDKNIFVIDDIVQYYCDIFIAELLDYSARNGDYNVDESRIQRKIKQLLKESVLYTHDVLSPNDAPASSTTTPPRNLNSTTGGMHQSTAWKDTKPSNNTWTQNSSKASRVSICKRAVYII